MTEDKEAIAKILENYKLFVMNFDNGTRERCNQEDAIEQILQTLTSLGYVKLAEQKLPSSKDYPQKSQYTSRYRLNLARRKYRQRMKNIIKLREKGEEVNGTAA